MILSFGCDALILGILRICLRCGAFTFNSGYRLSVGLENRIQGIETLISRWGSKIGNDASVVRFRDHWLFIPDVTNSRRALPTSRADALRYALVSVRLAPFRRHGWQSIVFAVLGFRVSRFLSRIRNSGISGLVRGK